MDLIGAQVLPGGGVHFRVWAPIRTQVDVVLEGVGAFALEPEKNGYFFGIVPLAKAGMLYRYRLGGAGGFPDPASRFQPEGPHGPSQIVDPVSFEWTDQNWKGRSARGQVIYELHIGTFTPEGTWNAASRELPELAALGITIIEVMPVADFPGKFGWGYDGVNLFAPTRLYGTPDDFRRFVDRAHALSLSVILDVVYNHLGPDGNYLREFSPHYFTDRYGNDWGEALNFDGPESAEVRAFFIANARYWIDEFHIDGLRLDATQQIFDASSLHIMAEIVDSVRTAARGRETFIVGENELQHTHLMRPKEEGGLGLDALWGEDFHRSAMVAMTGRAEGYYAGFHGSAQELLSALKYGFLYQGQHTKRKKRRGSPALDKPAWRFVHFLQNHDQVSNTSQGVRCHQLTSPGRYRALTALLLLGPQTPMLFQGQEFASSKPFVFFADHHPALAQQVFAGRRQFFQQFRSMANADVLDTIPDSADPKTFERCKLDLTERVSNAPLYAMHRDLLALRCDPAFEPGDKRNIDGAVLREDVLLLRFFHASGDRLLLVNLGRDLHLDSVPEPLIAPPEGMLWEMFWSSEDPKYGGRGCAALEMEEGWQIPGEAAVVLAPFKDATS